MIAIFGASGFVGSYLYNFYSQKYSCTLGTYFNQIQKNLIYFDILKSNLKDLNLNNIKYAIICSSESVIDRIKENPYNFFELNVKSQIRLLNELSNNYIIPIIISTDCVFDGNRGNYDEEDKKNPQNIYGQQKMIVEDFILNNLKKYLIIRTGKIHSSNMDSKNWLGQWIQSLQKGKSLECAIDQIFNPTHVNDLALGIDNLLHRNLTGIYHIAGSEIYSKYEIGLKICDRLSLSRSRINPVKINEIGLCEKRPCNTSLCNNKFVRITNHKFISLDESISNLLTCLGI